MAVLILPCVSHEGKQYVLKNILPGDFQYILDLQKLVDDSASVRTLVDSIPDRNMLVYPFLEANLQLRRTTAIPPSAKKNILRDSYPRRPGRPARQGHLPYTSVVQMLPCQLVALLTCLTDIKPANIMMDLVKQSDGTIGFENVKITDLESAVVLPPGPPRSRKAALGEPVLEEPRSVGTSGAGYPSQHLLLWHHGVFSALFPVTS